MDILLIGSGGREHCLAWKIANSGRTGKIYAIPGNAGISLIAECIGLDISKKGFKAIAEFVMEKGIGLTVIGPEAPLVEGIVDYFEERGLKIFGPNKKGALIEGSKVFSKELLNKYKIPSAGGRVYGIKDYQLAKKYIQGIKDFPVVLKADGLAAGKGVIIAGDRREALKTLDDFFVYRLFGRSGDRIIIEEYLEGYEVSVLCLCDGERILPMEPAQDYKRIFDGDKGKNTGGMGSYCPVPMFSRPMLDKAFNEIILPSYEAMIKEGIKYRGILYAGLLISRDQPYLLEYNCRFGDPETQAVLPRLKEDIVSLFMECIEGRLKRDKLDWDGGKSVCVVAASRGYPESSSSGDIIIGFENAASAGNGINVFHAGTAFKDNQIVTSGGRVLAVSALAQTFIEARARAYDGMGKIKFDGMQFRKDIAKKAEEVNR